MINVSEQYILETTHRIFRQQGVRAFCLRDVASGCGIKVSDLQYRFDSKKKLVVATVNHIIEKNSSYLKVNPSLSPSAKQELENFFVYMVNLINWFRPEIVFELKKYHEEAWNSISSFTEYQLKPYLLNNLQRGIADGSYRDDFDRNLFVNTYFQIIKSIYTEKQNTTEATSVVQLLHLVLINGIGYGEKRR